MRSRFKRNGLQKQSQFKRNGKSDSKSKSNNNGNGNGKKDNYFLQLIKDNYSSENKDKPLGNNGRKAKLTPVMQVNILKAIELGMPVESACHLVKVTPVTYYNWLKWGRAEDEKMKESLDFAIHDLEDKKQLNINDPLEMESFVNVFIKSRNLTKFFYFFNSIRTAEAQGHIKALESIRKATEGGKYLAEIVIKTDKNGNEIEKKQIERYLKPDWNAGAWYLERKYPHLYSQKITQEGSIEHQHNVKHDVKLPESVDRIADILGILLGSGLVQKRLAEYSTRELPAT